jgi:hypothetical protein
VQPLKLVNSANKSISFGWSIPYTGVQFEQRLYINSVSPRLRPVQASDDAKGITIN